MFEWLLNLLAGASHTVAENSVNVASSGGMHQEKAPESLEKYKK